MKKLVLCVSLLGAFAASACSHKQPPPPAAPTPPAPPPVDAAPPPVDAAPPVALHGAEIDVPGVIEFDLDKATLKPGSDAETTLESVRKILADNANITRVRVEGHTDSDDKDHKNQKLSEARAKTVVAWLVGKGIDAGRLVPTGCAAKDPLVPNTSPENKAKNRRTEFDIEQLDGKQPDDYTAPCAPNPKRAN